jgi:hypothetical protein
MFLFYLSKVGNLSCTEYGKYRHVYKILVEGEGVQNIPIQIVPQHNKIIFSSLLEPQTALPLYTSLGININFYTF